MLIAMETKSVNVLLLSLTSVPNPNPNPNAKAKRGGKGSRTSQNMPYGRMLRDRMFHKYMVQQLHVEL